MIVRRFFDVRLAQTSYLIGCARAGTALVIDPLRDVDQYLDAAEAEGLRISHVTETHIHADFVSGAQDLAQRTGATLLLSDEGDANWKYAYAKAAGARLVKDGDEFMVGNVTVQIVHTPGHTPEHICFLITDTAAADEPIAIATGDFVFVGDVGRPDLLERAAKYEGTMEAAAHTLFRSLTKFRALPDWLQIWPGHGAGSACGKGLSAVPHSTVGYEKRFNWALQVTDEDAFVRAVLEGQPEPPTYFAQMKRINKEGPAPFDPAARPRVGGLAELRAALAAGTMVVDTRRAEAFAAGFVPGTINIPLNKSFNTWAGWFMPFDRDAVLVVENADAGEALRELAMVGLDRVAMTIPTSVIAAAAAGGTALGTVPQIEAPALAAAMKAGSVRVLDVRGHAEWQDGHLPGATNIPVGLLPSRLAEVPSSGTLVLQCQTGGRSSIASSLLLAAGRTNIVNLTGGYEAWTAAGLPTER